MTCGRRASCTSTDFVESSHERPWADLLGGVVGAVAGLFLSSSITRWARSTGRPLGVMAGGAVESCEGPTVWRGVNRDLTVQTSGSGASIPRAFPARPLSTATSSG